MGRGTLWEWDGAQGFKHEPPPSLLNPNKLSPLPPPKTNRKLKDIEEQRNERSG